MSVDTRPWEGAFRGQGDGPPRITLEQVDNRTFVLGSPLRFTPSAPPAGIPPEAMTMVPADLIPPGTDAPDALPTTDLASVPTALRWFVSPYGLHTPAALIHDRLIDGARVAGVGDRAADRLFRLMLDELGLPFLRRWLMWAAVAYGTRWRAGGWTRLVVIAWTLLSLAGIATFAWALATSHVLVALIAAFAPLPASVLWGPQYGAGIVAGYSAAWILPPTVLGAVAYGVYWLIDTAIEWVVHLLAQNPRPRRRAVRYRDF